MSARSTASLISDPELGEGTPEVQGVPPNMFTV